MVLIQLAKIEALGTNEIDLISGGSICSLFNWCTPPFRIDGGDPMDPIGPVTEPKL
jgi:hypothetical protein